MKKFRVIIFIIILAACSGALFACGAKSEKVYFTVSFNTDGGTLVKPIKALQSTLKLTRPDEPEKKYSDFDNWYTDSSYAELFNFEQTLSGDTTVYAKWIPAASATCEVSFETNGGTPIDSVAVIKGKYLEEIDPPIKLTYTFLGWYTDSGLTEIFNPTNTKIKRSMTLYAKYIKSILKVTFDYQGGIGILPFLPIEYGEDYELPPVMHKNMTFDGWYSKKGGGGKRLTDSTGASVAPWNGKADCSVYAYFTGTEGLVYEKSYDNVCSVISFDGTANNVVIQPYYQGLAVKRINGNAFSRKSILSVNIPSTITEIGSQYSGSSFADCSNLQEVVFEENSNLTRINYSSFDDCTSLSKINIPETVEYIGYSAFDNTPFYTDALENTNGILYLGKVAYAVNGSTLADQAELDIKEGTVSITNNALSKTAAQKISVLNLPASLQTFYNVELSSCDNLTAINIAEDNEVYKSIDGILYSKDGTELSKYPMAKVGAEFTVPNSVSRIKRSAFSYCQKLLTLTVGSNVRDLEWGILSGYSTSVELLRFLGAPPEFDSSYDQDPLSYFRLIAVDPQYIQAYKTDSKFNVYADRIFELSEVRVESGCVILGTALHRFTDEESESAVVPEGVTTIKAKVFENYTKLKSITLPNSLLTIGTSAFYNCYNLTEITIPENVTFIGTSAFENCYNLAKIAIPESVTYIGDRAFENCSNLTEITIPQSVTFIGDYAFQWCSNMQTIHCHYGTSGFSAFWNADCSAKICTSESEHTK